MKKKTFGLNDVINEGDVPEDWEEQSLEDFMAENPDAIKVKDLGEWAWNEAKPSMIEHIENSKPKVLELADFLPPDEIGEFGLDYIDLAIACLGEAEIKKRIKDLKK